MISLITVSIGEKFNKKISMFLNSLERKSSNLLKEVIIIYNQIKPFEEVYYIKNGNIKVRSIGIADEKDPIVPTPQGLKKSHSMRALATHKAINLVNQPYIIISDDDVIFFKEKFDLFYLNLYQKYKLNIIGVSHPRWDSQAYGIFPTIINCLIKTEELPNKDFLKNQIYIRENLRFKLNEKETIRADGKYMLGGPPYKRYKELPYPGKLFDVGCNLWLWDKDRGRRSITFLSKNKFKYTTDNIITTIDNFNKDYIWPETLLKHAQCWSMNNKGTELRMKEWLIRSINKKPVKML